MGTQNLNYIDNTKYLGVTLSHDKMDDKDNMFRQYPDYICFCMLCFTKITTKKNREGVDFCSCKCLEYLKLYLYKGIVKSY